ncbi:hypothetical protein OPQ81_006038 [Rhizoctonia solani]|nr:hypothetical protein OPQ81_006038 [Rhizoctonia solani]
MATGRGPGSSHTQHIGAVWEDDNKIIVGIDIGATYSGVALTYLEKGEKQELHRIARWPGQGEEDLRSKIPTVIWYNLETKKAELFGAEALSRDGREAAADHGWKADMKLDPLPPGITLNQIYSDFLGYLLKHTKAFVEKRMARGKEIWEKYKPRMEVVLAHPNGWDTPEQHFLRKAAIDCGFVDFIIVSITPTWVAGFRLEKTWLCATLGGSTVDTTLYTIVSSNPVVQLREVRVSDSIQVGGILVNTKFEDLIRKALNNLELTPTQVDDFTEAGVEDFETFVKRNFGNPDNSIFSSDTVSIRVANTGSYGDAPTKIHRGCMKVPGSAIKECFDVCVIPILSSVGEQLKDQTVQHILLVGGFGDSPYLHTQFKNRFEPDGCDVVLANDFTSKAVADGCVIWKMLCSVVSRTPRHSFGVICARACLPWMPGFLERDTYIGPQGIPVVLGRWVQIAKKGVPVDAEEVYRGTIHHCSTKSNPTSISLEMELFSYSGDDEPMWAKDNEGNLLPKFEKVCIIKAEVLDIEGALKKQTGLLGNEFWDLAVDVCICFGTTELQAYLEWEQNGVKRRGPATVVPGKPVEL